MQKSLSQREKSDVTRALQEESTNRFSGATESANYLLRQKSLLITLLFMCAPLDIHRVSHVSCRDFRVGFSNTEHLSFKKNAPNTKSEIEGFWFVTNAWHLKIKFVGSF